MPIFTSLAFAGSALISSTLVLKQRAKTRLIDALAVQKPPTTTLSRLSRTKAFRQALLSNTRQQYQQDLNVNYDASTEQAAEQTVERRLIVAVTGLGLATVGTFVPILYLPTIACTVYGFQKFYRDTWHILWRERRLDYRALVPFLITISLATGYFWAAAFGAVFSALNQVLIAKTERRSKTNIANLFGDQIHTVLLLIDGVEIVTPLANVQAGDTVVVHAGQQVPVDGTIIRGEGTTDQRMLTGESQPVEKGVGDAVLAVTILLTGRLEVRVEQAGDSTVAAQIGKILGQTTDFKKILQSRTEKTLNQTVLGIIGLSAMALPVVGVGGAIAILWAWPGTRMMVLGPLSMLSYLQVAAQHRILIKDGRALEWLQEIDTVVFDKTGTLTLEQPTVSRIICYDQLSEREVLRYTAATEAKQSHPIARAILHAAEAQALVLPDLDYAEYQAGYGLKTTIAGQTIHIGSIRFMRLENIQTSTEMAHQQSVSHQQGHSMVFVAVNETLVGAIELTPTIRPEARQIVDSLHQRGLKTVIISGDHNAPTQRLADELGIGRAFAEVLPEDKAKLVEQLQAEGHKVCFVGDGINDSIALKTADISVSLRGATTIATDMAQIVLMDGSLRQLPHLFELSEAFAHNMQINLVTSVVPGVVGIAGVLFLNWG